MLCNQKAVRAENCRVGKEAKSPGHKTCSGGTTPSRFMGLTKQSKPNCINWNIGRGFAGNKSPPGTECSTVRPQPSPSASLGAGPFWGFRLGGDPQKARTSSPQGCGRGAKSSFLARKGLKPALECHHSCQNLTFDPKVTPEWLPELWQEQKDCRAVPRALGKAQPSWAGIGGPQGGPGTGGHCHSPVTRRANPARGGFAQTQKLFPCT